MRRGNGNLGFGRGKATYTCCSGHPTRQNHRFQGDSPAGCASVTLNARPRKRHKRRQGLKVVIIQRIIFIIRCIISAGEARFVPSRSPKPVGGGQRVVQAALWRGRWDYRPYGHPTFLRTLLSRFSSAMTVGRRLLRFRLAAPIRCYPPSYAPEGTSPFLCQVNVGVNSWAAAGGQGPAAASGVPPLAARWGSAGPLGAQWETARDPSRAVSAA